VLPPTPYAVLHLGASTPLKSWPIARWQALAQWLSERGVTPVWSAGKGETDLVDAADPSHRFTNYAGRLDLLQLAHLIKAANLLVCPDTGVAHLGRLTDTPTVALFGPGSPALCGAGQYWSESAYRAISIPIACRDQHVTFRREADWIERCARSHGPAANQCERPLCMERIGLATVQDEVLAVLAQATRRRASSSSEDEKVE
jgi:ADP-heptose:LPS heptosyltransferase